MVQYISIMFQLYFSSGQSHCEIIVVSQFQ